MQFVLLLQEQDKNDAEADAARKVSKSRATSAAGVKVSRQPAKNTRKVTTKKATNLDAVDETLEMPSTNTISMVTGKTEVLMIFFKKYEINLFLYFERLLIYSMSWSSNQHAGSDTAAPVVKPKGRGGAKKAPAASTKVLCDRPTLLNPIQPSKRGLFC